MTHPKWLQSPRNLRMALLYTDREQTSVLLWKDYFGLSLSQSFRKPRSSSSQWKAVLFHQT